MSAIWKEATGAKNVNKLRYDSSPDVINSVYSVDHVRVHKYLTSVANVHAYLRPAVPNTKFRTVSQKI